MNADTALPKPSIQHPFKRPQEPAVARLSYFSSLRERLHLKVEALRFYTLQALLYSRVTFNATSKYQSLFSKCRSSHPFFLIIICRCHFTSIWQNTIPLLSHSRHRPQRSRRSPARTRLFHPREGRLRYATSSFLLRFRPLTQQVAELFPERTVSYV